MGTIARGIDRLKNVATPWSRPILRHPKVHRFNRALNLLEALWDGLVSAGAVVAAIAVEQYFHLEMHIHFSPRSAVMAGALSGSLLVVLLDRDGAYQGGSSLLRIKETERVLRISTVGTLLALLLAYVTGHIIPRMTIGLSYLFVVVSLSAGKQMFYALAQNLRAKGIGAWEVVIYGAGNSGRRVFSALARSPKLGLMPVAMVDDDPELNGQEVFELGYRRNRSLHVSSGPITSDLLRWYNAKLLVVAIPSLPSDTLEAAVRAAQEAEVGVALMPQLNPDLNYSVDLMGIDGLTLLSRSVKGTRSTSDLLKRVLDLIVASLSLTACSPLFALIAFLVRLDSPGPVLFVQERVGKGGKRFRMYKFRTMYSEAPVYACSPRRVDDPRITAVGQYLRRTSLDELPQLINVVKGEMSLVGPRPEMPFVVESYTPFQSQRLSVLPGITGLWQLSGDRAFPIHENVQYDLYYIRYRGIFLDIAVLIHTLAFAMKGI